MQVCLKHPALAVDPEVRLKDCSARPWWAHFFLASSVGLLRRVPVQESGAILGPVDPDPGTRNPGVSSVVDSTRCEGRARDRRGRGNLPAAGSRVRAQDSPPPPDQGRDYNTSWFYTICIIVHVHTHICLYIYTHTDTGIVCPANILVTHFE